MFGLAVLLTVFEHKVFISWFKISSHYLLFWLALVGAEQVKKEFIKHRM